MYVGHGCGGLLGVGELEAESDGDAVGVVLADAEVDGLALGEPVVVDGLAAGEDGGVVPVAVGEALSEGQVWSEASVSAKSCGYGPPTGMHGSRFHGIPLMTSLQLPGESSAAIAAAARVPAPFQTVSRAASRASTAATVTAERGPPRGAPIDPDWCLPGGGNVRIMGDFLTVRG